MHVARGQMPIPNLALSLIRYRPAERPPSAGCTANATPKMQACFRTADREAIAVQTYPSERRGIVSSLTETSWV